MDDTPPDVLGACALPGTYRGRVTQRDDQLGLARIKPDDQGWSILVPVWKFPVVAVGLTVEFEVGHGGVVKLTSTR